MVWLTRIAVRVQFSISKSTFYFAWCVNVDSKFEGCSGSVGTMKEVALDRLCKFPLAFWAV